MASSNLLTKIFQCIDQNEDKLLDRLHEAVTILPDASSEKSLSSTELIDWTNEQFKSFGFSTELKNIDEESHEAGVPPVIFASLEMGHCPNKSTILVYSRLDASGNQHEDGWNIELTGSSKTKENVYVRGVWNMSSVIAWLNTIEAFRIVEIDIPVNIQFIIVPMEMESSVELKNLLVSEKDSFLDKVDYVCINQGYWLQSDVPSLVKKLKGLCYFSIELQCSASYLDLNKCSSIIQEATNDLIYLLGRLSDEKSNFDLSKLNLQAEELSEEEIGFYKTTDLDLDRFMEATAANSLAFNGDKLEMIKYRLINPNMTIHSIESSLKDGNEWSIPPSASAKLSIRSFDRNLPEVFKCVNTFIQECWKLRGSANKLTVSLEKIHDPWFADLDHVHYKKAVKAAQQVYHKPIRFINCGLTIPVVNTLQEVVGKNILLLPISSENSYLNETMPTSNYLDASKMFASYLHEIGEIPKVASESTASFVSCDSGPEVCVCGRIEEEIQAGSGDSEVAGPTERARSISEEDETKCVCPYRAQVPTKDEAIISDDLAEESIPPPPPKPCKCILQYQPVDVEIISLKSTPSKNLAPASNDAQKNNITASIETINCSCIPERYRTMKRIKENRIILEKQEELSESMRSVGSKISGISACEHPSGPIQALKLNFLGCVCPERSQETVCGEETQRDRMFCPVGKGKDEICNKGGKRRRHIAGPPPIDEDESEISLGPLSHCSCPSEESVVVPPDCDCSKDGENIDDEID